jgi:aspartate/methionine/tyrosine aminotransferase
VLTNPHAPSGTTSDRSELREIMHVANEHGFYVLCDEIYAEFERKSVPTLFSIDPQFGIVTTSFTKAYGLGGLKLGTALAEETLVNELYTDVLNTVGNTPNIVQIVSAKLLAEAKEKLEKHKKKWLRLKKETETRLNEMKLHFFQNKVGVTYWVRLPIRDSYEWINEYAIPKWSLAAVPGTFFVFRNNYKLFTSSMMRLGIGLMDPESRMLEDALSALEKALKEYKTRARYR